MSRRSDLDRVAYWGDLIERRRQSDLSVARFCEQVGVSSASFYDWQRKLRERITTPTDSPQTPRAESAFVPVRIVADPVPPATGVIEIEMPGALRLRVPPDCDHGVLRIVLSVLLGHGEEGTRSC